MNKLIGNWGDTTSGYFMLSFAHILKKNSSGFLNGVWFQEAQSSCSLFIYP